MADYKNIQDIKQKFTAITKSAVAKRAKDIIDPADVEIITSALTITNKYLNQDWSSKEFIEVQTDLITLQAILVSLASKYGDIMNTADNESSIISTARAKIRMDAKKYKKELEDAGEIVKITADDVKDLSYVLTEDAAIAHDDSRTMGNHLRFIYFAIKDQVQLLEKAAYRFFSKGEQC